MGLRPKAARNSLAFLPLDHGARAEYLRVKALPKALYGVEVAQPSCDALAKLTAACADFLLPRAAWCRSSTLALALAGEGSAIFPEARLLELRVGAFRGVLAKDADARGSLLATLGALSQEGAWGTWADQAKAGGIQPAPAPGHAARPAWAMRPRPKGPMRLLLCSWSWRAPRSPEGPWSSNARGRT